MILASAKMPSSPGLQFFWLMLLVAFGAGQSVFWSLVRRMRRRRQAR